MCSSKLYYHNPCHIEYTDQYRRGLQSKYNVLNDENNIYIILEYVAIDAIEQFIDDSSESSFPPKQLENIYFETMHTLSQNVSSHTTTRLVVVDIGRKILQQSNTSNYMAVKTTRLDRLTSETDWLKQLMTVLDPIQDEIIQLQSHTKSAMTDTESYDLHFPELKLLINLLCLTPSLRTPILLFM